MEERLAKRPSPGGHPPRARRLASVVPAVLVLALVAAACGGSSDGGTDGVASASGSKKASTDKKRDPQQAGLDYAKCMREHGIDMPDPQTDGDGFVMIGPGPGAAEGEISAQQPPEGFEEADAACRHHLEDIIQGGGGSIDPKDQDRALKFAQCMREHGVDMPDPDFSQGGVRVEIGGEGIDPTSQVFKDAQKACGSLFGPSEGPAAGVRSGGRA